MSVSWNREEGAGEERLTPERNKDDEWGESPEPPSRRFLVVAPSVSAVRRALRRAPGGARVVGRFDREVIECAHTMDAHSFARHWPVIKSRLEKAGLRVRQPLAL